MTALCVGRNLSQLAWVIMLSVALGVVLTLKISLVNGLYRKSERLFGPNGQYPSVAA